MNIDGRLRKSDYEVRDVDLSTARQMVELFHYAGGAANTATYLHGLFRKGALFNGECVGVAWWIPPTKSAALATFPDDWTAVLALSRLVIAPDTPKNACTFLLARSRALIDATKWRCLVTYADDWRGHSGGIYRADNWEYAGKTKPERTYVRRGRMVARKAGGKTRTHSEMIAIGAECVGSFSKHKFVRISGANRFI